MYNQQLETFIAVADARSFSRAAKQLYITSTAVIKQINLLESRVGVRLFNRNNRGISLTKAGESFYKDTKFLLQYMEDSVLRAQQAMHEEDSVIRIGTSPMTPAQVFLDLWPSIRSECPDIHFQLEPFENTPENARYIFENLGKRIDIVAGIFDEALLNFRKCNGLIISYEPICLAVSMDNPLAQKSKLTMHDLEGQTVMLIHPGAFNQVDLMRNELLTQYPGITVDEFSFYNTDVFNQCENSNKLLMAVKNWKNVHPLMKIVDVDWDYTIPFGLLYSIHPSTTVSQCIKAVRKLKKYMGYSGGEEICENARYLPDDGQ